MPKRSVCWVILSIIFVCCFLGTAGAAEEVTAVNRLFPASTDAKDPYLEKTPATNTPGSAAVKPPLPDAASQPAENNGEGQDQDLMEEALALLEESQASWAKGDLEGALELLDRAYALVLETDGDPAVTQQKDDLRLLVARRIMAIYTSMRTEAKGKRSEIPLLMNADVEKEIRSFQTVERNFFIESYRRSGMYRPSMVRQLKKAGLPEELSWLPLVESGFKIRALSRARALGPWQFIPSTGYKYGLNRTDWVDERMDVDKSTRAAIDYMKALHEMFGDWLTVLAAYNCGEGRVLRVISQQKLNYLDRFWDLYHMLPYETARYVPRFLATLYIIRDPKKYGMELPDTLDKEVPFETVKIRKCMKLAEIATRIETSEETLVFLNPELRHGITPDQDYELRVPIEKAEVLVKKMDEIPRWELPAPERDPRRFVRHRVKRGESLASIARKYRTTTKAIRSCNPAVAKRGVRVGQPLSIPVAKQAVASSSKEVKKKGTSGGGATAYKVKRGDTLQELAERFDTTPEQLRQFNRIKGNKLLAGQILKVSPQGSGEDSEEMAEKRVRRSGKKAKATTSSAGEGGKTYKVRKGDNLFRIATRNGTSVDSLRKVNNLGDGDSIRPGQIIHIR
ncbi:MAG: lytic transglycosylase [Deltaproteobacteria bacterium HGW-Deltaproteobacteria-19]|nr:MAG: lytic transglycosylase [Deltaproteobacteria bacterium HGW-Deltaproteobacteria-19]